MDSSILTALSELFRYLVGSDSIFARPFMQRIVFLRSSLLNENSEIEAKDPRDLDGALPGNAPDLELMPIPYNVAATSRIKNPFGIFSFRNTLVKPKSTGTVRLKSADVRDRPAVDYGFLSNKEDLIPLRKGLKLAMRMADIIKGTGYPLEKYSIPTSETEEDMDTFIRVNALPSYHYTSTCRMAPETDPSSGSPGVVDDELRVYGTLGLRVCDASVFPHVVSVHTQAPVVAVAEKCASLILAAHSP
jgi:choline dehydrogenase-like flavoprotein